MDLNTTIEDVFVLELDLTAKLNKYQNEVSKIHM
jgi:hypothetical protein